MEKQRIPADFLIGTSSSAWQIEGCAGKKEGQESWAELFYDTNSDIWYDDVGPKKASDFYHHYKEDIKKYRIDMLGIDYYFPIRVKARETAYDKDVFHPEFYCEPWEMPGRKYNADRGWEIYEEAVVDIGMRIKEDYGNIPWFISENGIGIEGEDRYRNKEGYIDDDYRIDFLKGHLQRALKVRNMGSNCFGYFVWSFVDNLSAINAFKNRYGLLELDLKTGNRIPKKSLYWFKEIMKDREV